MNFSIKFLFLQTISAIPAGGKDLADLRARESGNRVFEEIFGRFVKMILVTIFLKILVAESL